MFRRLQQQYGRRYLVNTVNAVASDRYLIELGQEMRRSSGIPARSWSVLGTACLGCVANA